VHLAGQFAGPVERRAPVHGPQGGRFPPLKPLQRRFAGGAVDPHVRYRPQPLTQMCLQRRPGVIFQSQCQQDPLTPLIGLD
jgi:hypothetical protein